MLSIFFHLPLNRLFLAKSINLVLGCFSIIEVFLITHRLFPSKTAIIAASIIAINPRNILMTNLVASENLFIPVLLGWILAGMNLYSHPTTRNLILGGTWIGLACLTRSFAVFLFLPFILPWIWIKPRPLHFSSKILLLLFTQFIILLPWGVRNKLTLGEVNFLTTTGGINLFIGNYPPSTGVWYPWVDTITRIDPEFLSRSISQHDKIAGKIALEWIRQNPVQAMSTYIHKWVLMVMEDRFILDATLFGKSLSPPWPAVNVLPPGHPVLAKENLINTIQSTIHVFILLNTMIGICLALTQMKRSDGSERSLKIMFLLLTGLYFPTVAALYLANSRFLWPAMDLLLPFTAFSLTLLSGWVYRSIIFVFTRLHRTSLVNSCRLIR